MLLIINYILGAVSIPLPNAGSRNLYNDPLARHCFITYSTTSESETVMNKLGPSHIFPIGPYFSATSIDLRNHSYKKSWLGIYFLIFSPSYHLNLWRIDECFPKMVKQKVHLSLRHDSTTFFFSNNN
jgi:hypothetical protein